MITDADAKILQKMGTGNNVKDNIFTVD